MIHIPLKFMDYRGKFDTMGKIMALYNNFADSGYS
jgi:hypothetical protein